MIQDACVFMVKIVSNQSLSVKYLLEYTLTDTVLLYRREQLWIMRAWFILPAFLLRRIWISEIAPGLRYIQNITITEKRKRIPLLGVHLIAYEALFGNDD